MENKEQQTRNLSAGQMIFLLFKYSKEEFDELFLKTYKKAQEDNFFEQADQYQSKKLQEIADSIVKETKEKSVIELPEPKRIITP